MKKVILMLLVVMISSSTYSQLFYKVTKATVMYFENDEWVRKEPKHPQRMYVIIKGNVISITNKAESKYVVNGDGETVRHTNHKTVEFNGWDGDGNGITILIKRPYESEKYATTITVLHDDDLYAVEYVVTASD